MQFWTTLDLIVIIYGTVEDIQNRKTDCFLLHLSLIHI